jgi:hypothetical protein
VLRRLAPAVCLLAITASITVAIAPAAGAVELLDRKKLTKAVAATVTAAHPDLPVTKVVCLPKKVKRKPGATATCGVDAGGFALEMLVTVNDKRGNVSIASTQALIPKANAEFLVAVNATLPATADCGPAAYLVKKPGESFTCTATFADGTQSVVTVTPTDVAGNASITAAT